MIKRNEANLRVQNSEPAFTAITYQESDNLFKTNSMNLPMQDHELKLKLMLESLQRQIEEDEKDLQMLRPAMMHTHYEQVNEHNTLSREFVEQLADVTVHLRKLCDLEQQEHDGLQKQIEGLKQEKNKLKQASNVLEHKVGESERLLGVGQDGMKTI